MDRRRVEGEPWTSECGNYSGEMIERTDKKGRPDFTLLLLLESQVKLIRKNLELLREPV